LKRAVFLDRDGVINRAIVRDGKPHPPQTLGEVELVPDALPALRRLHGEGFLLIVVTNQPDVARRTQERSTVEAINNHLAAALPIDEFVVCYHDDDACECRKPKPGGILDAATRLGIDVSSSFLIGDRWRDIEAGQRAGCFNYFIDYGYAERQPVPPFSRVRSLAEAVDDIVTRITAEESMKTLQDLKVKLFADGADKAGMVEMYRKPFVKGFTTNPTLMRKAGITDYRGFAHEILAAIPDRPISFEVFSDEFDEMERQAREIATWGANVYVKIPITNTRREPAYELVRALSHDGVKVNVTAMMTLDQVRAIADALRGGAPSNVSVFAGRIADTGRDPMPIMAESVRILADVPGAELIWASPRELLNVFQADEIGCHIITATNDILKKLDLIGRDLADYSLDTVKMFFNDAAQAGFALDVTASARR
jgi:transaldolase